MGEKLIQWEALSDFSKRIMMAVGVSAEDAFKVADNLVLSNLRGIDSHGVSRLRRYVDGVVTKYIIPDARPKAVRETSVLANVDGGNGLGQVAGHFSMELAIEKARKEGLSMVTTHNSNHYGFAGYYPLMALKHDLIGVSMTNSAPLVVPTYGKNALIGTNPIAVSAPTSKRLPWVMDFANSVTPRGKIELYNRLGKKIPEGWATDETGRITTDAARVLKNLAGQLGGGILPLGGESETYGSHKGYGLLVMVDIFCGILSGANYGPKVTTKKDGKIVPPSVGHMFLVINPDFFIELDEFKRRMDDYMDTLAHSEKSEGQDRIYLHGEKEFEEDARRRKNGIPLDEKTVESLTKLSEEFGEKITFME